MEIRGTLTGLTPKATGKGREIEIKVSMAFDADALAELAAMFGERVTCELDCDQQELGIEEAQTDYETA